MGELGRVLVVDDAEDVRRVLQEFFGELGYAVAVASDGDAALAAIDEFGPDVLFLDLWMPGLPGTDVFTAVRLRDPWLPVIVITADNDVNRAKHLLSCGAFDYVPKPFHFEVLERVVGAAMGSGVEHRACLAGAGAVPLSPTQPLDLCPLCSRPLLPRDWTLFDDIGDRPGRVHVACSARRRPWDRSSR